jgi:hypothetical protein
MSAYWPTTPVFGRLNFAGILKGGGRVAVGVAVDSRLPMVRVGGALGVLPEGNADALAVRVGAATVAVGDAVAARTVAEPEKLAAPLTVARQGLLVCVELALGERETKKLRDVVALTEGERVPAAVFVSEGAEVEEALKDGDLDVPEERLGEGVRLPGNEPLADGETEREARGEAVEEALSEPDPVGETVLFTEKERDGLPVDVFEAVTLRVSEGRLDMETVGFVENDGEVRAVLEALRERTDGVAVELRDRTGENVAQALGRGVREPVKNAVSERVGRGLLDAPAREPEAVRVGFDTEDLGVPVTDAVFVDVLVTVPEGALVTVPPLTLRTPEPVAEAEPDFEKKVADPEAVEEGVLTGAVRVGVSPEDWLPDNECRPVREEEGVPRTLPEALREPAAEAVVNAEVLAVLDADGVLVPFDDADTLSDTEKVAVGDIDTLLEALRRLHVLFADALGLAVPVLTEEEIAELEALAERLLRAVPVAEEEMLTVTVAQLLPLADVVREIDVHGVADVEPHADRVSEGDADDDAFTVSEAQLAEGDSEGVIVCVNDSDAVDVEDGVTEVVPSHLSEVSAI